MSFSVFLASNFDQKMFLYGDYNQLEAKSQFWLHVTPKVRAD